jgi:hypothetical protein
MREGHWRRAVRSLGRDRLAQRLLHLEAHGLMADEIIEVEEGS